VQKGYGNDLNNWPNQAFKIFGQYALGPNLQLHGNAQFFWDYQGAKDGLAALELAVQGDSLEGPVEEALRKIREQDAFGLNSRLNFLLRYTPTPKLKFNVFVLNLLGPGTNRRHAYDSGNNRPSPHRVRFIREERAAGLGIEYAL
jgi:hypothetical protein